MPQHHLQSQDKITIDPPTAKELISSPMIPRKASPPYRKNHQRPGDQRGPQLIDVTHPFLDRQQDRDRPNNIDNGQKGERGCQKCFRVDIHAGSFGEIVFRRRAAAENIFLPEMLVGNSQCAETGCTKTILIAAFDKHALLQAKRYGITLLALGNGAGLAFESLAAPGTVLTSCVHISPS